MVIEAIKMRLGDEPKTWAEICDELSFEDERELRRIAEKYFIEVASDLLSAELKAGGLGG